MQAAANWSHAPHCRGAIIFDNSAVKRLAALNQAEALRRSLWAVGLRPFATELLLVETFKASDLRISKHLELMRALAGEDCVLPWVSQVLHTSGTALLTRAEFETLELSSLAAAEGLEGREQVRARCHDLSAAVDDAAGRLGNHGRSEMQALLASEGVSKGRHTDLPEWLDFWRGTDAWASWGEELWTRFGLSGSFPRQAALFSDSWCLALDAIGTTIFRGRLMAEKRKAVGMMDLYQLVYLGGTEIRVLVTDDREFGLVAQQIVSRRFPNARVQLVDEFLRSSGLTP